MWRWKTSSAAPLLLALMLPLAAAAGERCLAIDGDTLVCNRQKIRLTNVYAAELNQPGGAAAKQRLRVLIASGEVVIRPLGSDRYGRILAEVYVGGRRIEQSDIGPRAGRGAQWGMPRHIGATHGRSSAVRNPESVKSR
jgi:micrococcal nuclease